MPLPKLHYISQGNTPEKHLQNIQKACTYGAELVQLRIKNGSEESVLKSAYEARAITAHFQTRLIINDYYKIAKEVKADGVHLGQTDADPAMVREFLGNAFTIGGTANTLEDCQLLQKKQVDYIGLGPFTFTTTKKNLSPIIPLKEYQGIVKEINRKVPIIAIGGITLEDAPVILKTGVYGLAVSGEITKDFLKIQHFHRLLKGSKVQEQVWNAKKN